MKKEYVYGDLFLIQKMSMKQIFLVVCLGLLRRENISCVLLILQIDIFWAFALHESVDEMDKITETFSCFWISDSIDTKIRKLRFVSG